MRHTTRLLLLLIAGLPVAACFDFGKYSFPEQADGVGGGGPVAAAGSSGQDLMTAGASGGSGVMCSEPPCVLPLLPAGALGASCQTGAACDSGYCSDGVCCAEVCGAACEACNVRGSEGFCQGIPLDDQCLATQGCPASSDCVQYGSGSSGVCAGRGSCSANAGCTPTYLPVATPCAGGTGECDGGGACVGSGKLSLGAQCESGEQCTEGFCVPTGTGTKVCCNQACNGTCEQCSSQGQCNEAPPLDAAHCTPPRCAADDICHNYPDSPTEARCASFGKCVGDEACVPEDLRPASDCTCGPGGCKLAQGKACSSAEQCGTGFCNNGVCCDSACDGTCQQCQQDTGVCGTISGCECAVGATTTCGKQFGSLGDCAPRQITCSGSGRWPVQQCNAQSAELCNDDDRDEDCNGNARNGCTCLNGQLSDCTEQRRAQGVCARRILTCTNGQWPTSQCNPTSQELCGNGLDDDCDGAVDENPPCAPVFDGKKCNFSRASCEDLRCSQCGGCDGCQNIIICVRDDHPGCATANDPVCRNSGCADVVALADQELFGDNFDIPASEFAADYIRCSCTQ